MDKLWYSYTMKFYTVMRMNELVLYTTLRMNLIKLIFRDEDRIMTK